MRAGSSYFPAASLRGFIATCGPGVLERRLEQQRRELPVGQPQRQQRLPARAALSSPGQADAGPLTQDGTPSLLSAGQKDDAMPVLIAPSRMTGAKAPAMATYSTENRHCPELEVSRSYAGR